MNWAEILFTTPVPNWAGLDPNYRIQQQIDFQLSGSALLVPH
jgi:hypothetical protein